MRASHRRVARAALHTSRHARAAFAASPAEMASSSTRVYAIVGAGSPPDSASQQPGPRATSPIAAVATRPTISVARITSFAVITHLRVDLGDTSDRGAAL